jgi:DtxR family Mn-dependent transcriptional regulator
MSVAKENFIKTIYHLEQQAEQTTRPGNVARRLGISSAAATDMARKLADYEFIDYRKYQQLKLTDKGRKLAMNILRKHRLWETFLHRTFDLSLHEIHREAELLEHQTSDFLADKLDAFLGNPQFDPHGDPIPDANGEVTGHLNEQLLSSAVPGHAYTISRLSSSEEEFFTFCKANHLEVGFRITVLNQYPKTKMTEILTGDGKLFLSAEIANTLFVQPALSEKNKTDDSAL